jgi:AcrR family transcriptional regulator
MSRKRGRPRGFDEDQVLDHALQLFWDRGYEGTSLNGLLSEMPLNKPSLYKTFGSKEELFQRVLKRYDERHLDFRREALAERSTRAIIERLLAGMVNLHVGEGRPRGCLMTNAALACSPETDPIRSTVARERDKFRQLLMERFQDAARSAPLPVGLSIGAAASLVQTMIEGLAVQVKCGATRKELEAVCQAFIAMWPDD